MNRLALIGRNISHSLSPALYRKLINDTIEYDLLDYQSACEIPALEELFLLYQGINITAPYKEHFLDEVTLSSGALRLRAINCVAKKGDRFYGENTDYLAVLDILKSYVLKHSSLEITVLGDGVMSRVVQNALVELRQEFVVFSRKKNVNFSKLDLKTQPKEGRCPLIINTCSRDYVCELPMPTKGVFWDLNYNFLPHQQRFSTLDISYIDGIEMLELQAKHALVFWSDI